MQTHSYIRIFCAKYQPNFPKIVDCSNGVIKFLLLLDKRSKMSRDRDRLEVLASDLASRYGEQDELVRNVRMSIAARKDIRASKPLPIVSTSPKAVSTSTATVSQSSALIPDPK